MRRVSRKQQDRINKARPIRERLVREAGECMLCGTSPKRPRHRLMEHNQLCCHEVLNGPLRSKVLAEPSCLIVACWYCNQCELNNKGDWPLARQLAVIKQKAPQRYDLQRVLELRNPNAMNYVTESEVDEWTGKDLAG